MKGLLKLWGNKCVLNGKVTHLRQDGNDNNAHIMKLERTNKQGQDHEEGNHVTNGGVRPWKTHILFIKHMQHVST